MEFSGLRQDNISQSIWDRRSASTTATERADPAAIKERRMQAIME